MRALAMVHCCEDRAKLFGSSCFGAVDVAGSLDLVIDAMAFSLERQGWIVFNWGCKGFQDKKQARILHVCGQTIWRF